MHLKRWCSCLLVPFLLVATGMAADDANNKSLEVGDPAPSFEVEDDSGETWDSKQYFGKKIVVVYFYPADMTGGCTKQACSFRDDMPSIADKDVEVVGVSGDSVENHQLFKRAHDLNFTLLADVDGVVADKFGVPKTAGEKSVAAMIDGVEHTLNRDVTIRRWTFIVDQDGKIAYKDDKVSPAEDSKKIRAAIEKMRS